MTSAALCTITVTVNVKMVMASSVNSQSKIRNIPALKGNVKVNRKRNTIKTIATKNACNLVNPKIQIKRYF
jgi:hypothetical protein